MNRKNFIKEASLLGLGLSVMPFANIQGSYNALAGRVGPDPRIKKKIIVAGAGIGGLCCAYELNRMGHEVVVMDAAGRYGGKVFSAYGDLSDGLYAEYGAEGFTIPGYQKYREYIEEFNIPVLPYFYQKGRLTRVDNAWFTERQLQDIQVDKAKAFGGFNKMELRFLSSNPVSQLEKLYLEPYLAKFTDEYQPFGVGYDHLDIVPIADIYKKEGASKAGLAILGGSHISALQKLWECYIMNQRGVLEGHQRYRIKGGNQTLVNEFAKRLGNSILLDCQVSAIEQGNSGVTVTYREFGEEKRMSADYVANCLPVTALKNVVYTPDLPLEKRFVFDNLVFEQTARIIFQARSKFWLDDNLGINLTFNHPSLRDVAQFAEEVDTHRAALKVRAPGGTNPLDTLAAFKELYPGKKSNIDIELTLIKDWSTDRFTPGCQRVSSFPMGKLSSFWPHLITPFRRVYFAGGYADNRTWGMEAAVNSANRIATQIDQD